MRQGFHAPSREGAQSHQAKVCFLVRRLLRHRPTERLDCRAVLPALLVQRGKLGEQREEQPPQLLAAALRPVFVGVPRQELPGVQIQRRPVSGGLVVAPRRLRRLLESFHVHPQLRVRAQHELLAPGIQVPGGGLGVRLESAAGGVEDLVEVVGRRLPPEVRPEEVRGPLPMHAMPRREGEQLHQVRRLAQPPTALLDGTGTHRDPEPAEQANAHRLGAPDQGDSRSFLRLSHSA